MWKFFAPAEPQYEPLRSMSETSTSPLLASMAAHSASLQASRSPSSEYRHPSPTPLSHEREAGSSRWAMLGWRDEDEDALLESDEAASESHIPFTYGYQYVGSPGKPGAQPSRRIRRRRRPWCMPAAITTLFITLFAGSYAIIYHFAPDRVSGSWGWPQISSDPNAIEFDTPTIPLESTDEGVFTLSDPSHVLVPITHSLPPSPHMLKPMSNRLPLDLLDHYYTYGSLPSTADPESVPNQSTIDLVYLFVNASSPYFQAANEAKALEEGVPLWGKKRHWRDNGELRGALRSGAISLAQRARTIHVISGAYEFDASEGNIAALPSKEDVPEGIDVSGWQMGQIPAWLQWDKADQSRLRWHFHPEIYRLPRDDDGSLPATLEDTDEAEWRRLSLPTFNSFEIETRIPFVKDLSEQYVMSNDDMFMMRDMSTADFHHPLLGTVVRLDPSSQLYVNPIMPPHLKSTGGEWGGLQHASSLISARFPYRSRMYMHHLPKAQTLSLAHEASIMFASSMTESATRAFRESKRGDGDVEMAWLVTHLRVERWREALLWVWAVGKVGGEKGVWGEQAREEIRKVLGMEKGNELEMVRVERGERKTLDDLNDLMRQAGWEGPKNTEYTFSSFDGHMPARPDITNQPITCEFPAIQCLPDDFFTSSTEYSAAEMFANLTFVKPGCGDCLITALITASGERGLGAFLPAHGTTYRPPKKEKGKWERKEPMLPLTSKWEDAEFGIAENVRVGQDKWAGHEVEEGVVDLRAWSVKLLSRYAYVFGSSPAQFSMVHSTLQLLGAVDRVTKDPTISMVCINDDQPDNVGSATAIAFAEWMKRTWGGASEWVNWEKDGYAWL